MLIKARLSRQLPTGERINASRRSKGERGIRQRRYWEHAIRDEEVFAGMWITSHNSVRHGHVARPADWLHSSVHRYIQNGILPADWGAGVDPADSGGFGE